MDEEVSDTVNLDLNLGPAPEPASSSAPNESVHFNGRAEEPRDRIREAHRLRTRQRWRWRQVQIPAETQNISVILNQMLVMANAVGGSSLQADEGSVTAEERTSEKPESCDTNKKNASLADEKVNASDGSFFDCNICLDLAGEPVVTCCGHLFCWPCLYSWLHLHSDAKECPVCKGEVTIKGVTPIYGRGNNGRELPEDPTLKVPQRPQARRIESLRQTIQRAAFNMPADEMLRRIGNRELGPPLRIDGGPESLDRSQTLFNRILASNRMRREQSPVPVLPAEDNLVVDQGRQAFRVAMPSVASSGLSLGAEAYVDDRNSFSSIAAVINSESVSTSSTRRRNDGSSRISDVDSGDSRSHRRRLD